MDETRKRDRRGRRSVGVYGDDEWDRVEDTGRWVLDRTEGWITSGSRR